MAQISIISKDIILGNELTDVDFDDYNCVLFDNCFDMGFDSIY